jgi:hypothetical protein
MTAVACYLVGDSCTFVRDFDIIILLFSGTPLTGVCSENSGVMLPKSRMMMMCTCFNGAYCGGRSGAYCG